MPETNLAPNPTANVQTAYGSVNKTNRGMPPGNPEKQHLEAVRFAEKGEGLYLWD